VLLELLQGALERCGQDGDLGRVSEQVLALTRPSAVQLIALAARRIPMIRPGLGLSGCQARSSQRPIWNSPSLGSVKAVCRV
jgi:hypothetical protein